MKTNLEKYLKENRFRLDTDKPDNDVIWEGIRTGLDKKQNKFPDWFWKVAAILIFAVSTTYFVINETNKNQSKIVSLADISAELGKQEAELQGIVQVKWKEIEPLLTEENAQIHFLLDEIQDLDEVYKAYQTDLGISDAQEQIVTVLLDYYQKKIKILNRLLHEIQKQEKHENTITL